MKKEQLIAELAKLRKSHEDCVSVDTRRRKEFAKVFNWYKPKGSYDYGERELKTPSWEEIFTQVGRLDAKLTAYDFEGNISELEYTVEQIQKTLNQEKNET